MTVLELSTPSGPARAHVDRAVKARAALVLGHGAGGGVDAPDLLAVAEAARADGISVVRVEQPYRVAGRRAPPRAAALDSGWIPVVQELRHGPLRGLPLVVGGRSSGARVACRTAAAVGAAGVLCLAFPLPPPRRGAAPAPSRAPELDAVAAPLLVVQGVADRFGIPEPTAGRRVVQVPGDHALRRAPEAVGAAVRVWLWSVTGLPETAADVEVRTATSADIPAIAALHDEGWLSFRPFLPESLWGPRTLERRLREWPAALEQREVLLAAHGDRVLGFVSLRRAGTEGELSTYFVTSAARGRGIGTLLLEHATARLAGGGAETVTVRTFADGPATALLERFAGRPGASVARDGAGSGVAELTYAWPAWERRPQTNPAGGK